MLDELVRRGTRDWIQAAEAVSVLIEAGVERADARRAVELGP